MIAEIGAAAAVGTGVIAYAALHRNSGIFGPVQGRLPGRDRVVALTFDDGPNPEATPPILDTLAREGVPATFFILGRHADQWPALVSRAAADGHAIGNHGFFHRRLLFRSPAYVRRDLELGAKAIERASGVTPRLFRAPHGNRNPWVSPIARALGERTVGWSLGVWDSDQPGVDEIARRVVDGVRPGSIVLLHDGDGYDPDGDRTQTALALPLIIGALRARGYAFTSLA